jgi:hypothetical protein
MEDRLEIQKSDVEMLNTHDETHTDQPTTFEHLLERKFFEVNSSFTLLYASVSLQAASLNILMWPKRRRA